MHSKEELFVCVSARMRMFFLDVSEGCVYFAKK